MISDYKPWVSSVRHAYAPVLGPLGTNAPELHAPLGPLVCGNCLVSSLLRLAVLWEQLCVHVLLYPKVTV